MTGRAVNSATEEVRWIGVCGLPFFCFGLKMRGSTSVCECDVVFDGIFVFAALSLLW